MRRAFSFTELITLASPADAMLTSSRHGWPAPPSPSVREFYKRKPAIFPGPSQQQSIADEKTAKKI